MNNNEFNPFKRLARGLLLGKKITSPTASANNISKFNQFIQQRKNFKKQIKFSIVVPLFNASSESLTQMINSVLSQTYSNWELCVTDCSDNDHAYTRRILAKYSDKDCRIKYKKYNSSSVAGAINEAISFSCGSYILLLDSTDFLHPSALFEYALAINRNHADLIYSDNDCAEKIGDLPSVVNYKPDFSIDLLRSTDYIGHSYVFKRNLLNKTGMFDSRYDGMQNYDMLLRICEQTNNIFHISKILHHSSPGIVNGGFNRSSLQCSAVSASLERLGLTGEVIPTTLEGVCRIKYKLAGNPLVSIIIPNKDHVNDLDRCITSILEKTAYKNYEIIILENNSVSPSTFNYYDTLMNNPVIRVVPYCKKDKNFNFAALNNFAAELAGGEHLLFLNNDTEIINADWLTEMLMFSQRMDVGAVGAKLYYPDNTLQHAGVIVGIGGVAGHAHKHFDKASAGYQNRCMLQQNFSAVTAACMMMKKSVFFEIGGFDERFAVAFNDIDLCMKIRQKKYQIVWTPYAELYHHESVSRGSENSPGKKYRFLNEIIAFQNRWNHFLKSGDPFYNPNLTITEENFSFRKFTGSNRRFYVVTHTRFLLLRALAFIGKLFSDK